MKLGKYFSLQSSTSMYICREGAMIMYRVIRGKAMRVLLKAPANVQGGVEAGMEFAMIGEEDLWPYGLWVGSFYEQRKVK